jgi:hypothetical protein
MSMLVAAQLTAWATLSLAALALVAAVFAALAWRAQNAEIKTLQGQLASQEELTAEQKKLTAEQLPVLRGQAAELEASREQREQEAQERREAYVSRVFIWTMINFDPISVELPDGNRGFKQVATAATHIRNAGELPVYDVIFSWAIGDVMGHQIKYTKPIMPGDPEFAAQWTVPDDVVIDIVKASAFLRDTAGNRWRIRAEGRHESLGPEEWPPHVW